MTLFNKSSNALIDDTAQPATGVQYAYVHNHFGGPLIIDYTVTGTAPNFDIVCCTKIPTQAGMTDPHNVEEYAAKFAASDWIGLDTAKTASGRYKVDVLNPCLLAIKVNTNGAANTRIRAIIN